MRNLTSRSWVVTKRSTTFLVEYSSTSVFSWLAGSGSFRIGLRSSGTGLGKKNLTAKKIGSAMIPPTTAVDRKNPITFTSVATYSCKAMSPDFGLDQLH